MKKKKNIPPEEGGKEPHFEPEPKDISEYNPEHQIDRNPQPDPKEPDPLKEWDKGNRK